VLGINFHGSKGYGQEFVDSINNDWGGKPFEDIIKSIDYAIKYYSFIDENRIGGLGASYGGYMVNFINGHNDDGMFKCLVSHAGIFDLPNFYFVTEELWFPEYDFKGNPWHNKMNYEKFSPANFVDKWKTPMLISHGGKDFRVPESCGMAAFTLLQRKGIESKFLYFPDESHWVAGYHNSIFWHDQVFAWLAKFLKK